MQSSQIYKTSLISQIITHFFLYCAVNMLNIGSLLLNKKTTVPVKNPNCSSRFYYVIIYTDGMP